jgi:hypothetical protein
MRRLTAILGYVGAALTIAAMLLAPFVLFNVFGKALVATGIHVDPVYAGGEPLCTVTKDGYRVVINRPVLPVAPLTRAQPFVQMAWEPADGLPLHIADEVDIDGDGQADLLACFDVPHDLAAALYADVTPIGNKVRPLHHVSRSSGVSALIVRVNNRIVLRVPLTREQAAQERARR